MDAVTSSIVQESDDIGTFAAADYCVFILLLIVSAAIGIYFAVVDRKKQSSDNYLLAGRSFSGFPVSLSLTASFMSAITVLGTPAEIYVFGTTYWWYSVSYGVAALVTATVFVPVFYKMKITSIYQYLQERFNKSVRVVTTCAFILQTIIYMGMVMYMPALALNKVTGLSLVVSILTTGLVCTFYTSIGGMKAVVWNDVVQCVVMVIGFLAIIIQGSITAGGISEVFNIANQHQRIDFFQIVFSFDFDPRVRHSVWSIWIGASLTWIAIFGVNQSMVQRYLSCRNIKQAKLSLVFSYIGLLVILVMACLCGIVMFAVYYNCDPLTSKKVEKSDQLMPYLVMDIFQSAPGIPGLFVASAYSGTLSTVSTGINALACSTYEDLIKPHYPSLSGSRSTLISKGLVVAYGLVGLTIAFLVSLLDNILIFAMKIFAIIGGPVLGVFCLGFFIPIANSVGTLVGLCAGLASGFWLAVGSFLCPPSTMFTRPLPLSTEGCTNTSTVTISEYTMATLTTMTSVDDASYCSQSALANSLYSLSYCHYSTFLVTVTITVGVLVSICTGGLKSRSSVPKHLLAYSKYSYLRGNIPPKIVKKSSDSEKKEIQRNSLP